MKRTLKFTLPLIVGLAFNAHAVLQWSSYDTSGNLVTANVATGGDLSSGTSATFTIPASTQLSFVTKSFTPFSIAGAGSKRLVGFQMSASGGLSGVASTVRVIGWGCYNSAGTGGFSDDVGYFGLLNAGNYTEPYYHSSGNANLFMGTKPGQGTTTSGFPVNNVTYTNRLQLNMNSTATGISLGTGNSATGAGVLIAGPGVTQYSYINPVTPLVGGVSSFDEFAFMFNNTTTSNVTVTLSGIELGDSLTWDASGTSPGAPTDGAGNWSTTNSNWSSGLSDTIWSQGYSAVIGSTNGAAGTITITEAAGVTVSNLTFNPASSGNYTLASSGGPLLFTGTPTVTVADDLDVSAQLVLGGSGFVKEGGGQLKFTGGTASTNTGLITINNGSLYHGSGANAQFINCDMIINPNGKFISQQNNSLNTNITLILNGGVISNVVFQTTMTAGKFVLDSDGLIGDAVGNTYFGATNYDVRSGRIYAARYRLSIDTYKSTAGTVIISNRPNSSGVDGHIVTMNGGTLMLDKSSQSANRLKTGSLLTLGGGTLIFTNGNSAVAPSTENPSAAGVLLKPGASYLQGANAGSSGGNASLGAINRTVGSTLDFAKTGPGSFTTTTPNNNGILGGWATTNGSDWLVGTTFAGYAAYQTDVNPANWVSTDNVTLSGDPSASLDNTTINSLRIAAAATVTVDASKTLTLSSGGLLMTGSGAATITGGSLRGGAAAGDLIIHQYSSGTLTIASDLADNSGSSLTKSGPGRLVITGVNSMTGTNYLNGGVIEVSDLSKLASGPLVLNAGVLNYTGTSVTENRTVTLNGLGATFDISTGTTLTLASTVNGSGASFGDLGGVVKAGGGTLVLTASNYFNGETVVSNGTLVVQGTNSYNPTVWAAGKVSVYGGTLGGTGIVSGPVVVKNGGTIAPGASIGTLTLATNLTLENGSTNLFEQQNGVQGDLLQVQGNLTIQPNALIAISVLGSPLEPTTNTLITYTGTKTGSFNPTVVVVGGSLNSSVSIDESTPGQINLVAVPQVALTCQPQDAIASTNDPVTFTVCATGSEPITYQWYFTTNVNTPFSQIPDATNSSYFIAAAQGTNNGLYQVVVANSYNSVTSSIAALIVGNVTPQLSGPFDQTVIQGSNVTFSTTVVLANPAPTLQWQTNDVDVTGATTTSLTLNNVQYSQDNTKVSVIASNAGGVVTNSATLTVIVWPSITPQPTNITVNVGDSASFISGATGVPTPGLQWYKTASPSSSGAPVAGETSGTLTFGSAQGTNVGYYFLVATNSAGSVTSSVVKLTVNSTTLAVAGGGLAPANGSGGICYDTPLYVNFNGPISIVNSGKIRIFNVNDSSTPVDVIDMGSNTVVVSTLNAGAGAYLTNNIQPHSLFPGDSQVINYFPVIISGNTAAIYPHGGVMTSNQTYYVTMDNGVVADSNGAYFAGISDTNTWKFTTKVGGPANPTNIIVSADGSGDFVTVQGACDSVPLANANYTLINIQNGTYTEIVNISGKGNITLRGESRQGTVVQYGNNNNLTPTTAARMAFKVNGADIKLENMTINNTTPQGGSQAEALLIYNNGLRCVVNNCDINSRQDTILINQNTSQGYFYNCKIVGNFDYVWGVGVGYFDTCVFRTITNIYSGSYNLTAARTATSTSLSATTPWQNPNGTTYSAYGFSFVNCVMEAEGGVTGITLAGSNGTAGGLDSWVNCFFDTAAYVTPSTALSNSYVFWQYNNTNLAGNAQVSFANVQTIGVTNNDPRLLAATNVVTWFSGWQPQLAPNILADPAGTNVNSGEAITLTVSATGIPAPAYQWLKNGTNVPGATSSVLSIPTAAVTDAGDYSVVVSNAAGSVTSTTASVTVNPPVYSPPTISSFGVIGGQFSITFTGDPGATYGVSTSTNLIDWSTIFSTNAPTLPYMWFDPNPIDPARYYKVFVN